MGDVVALVCGGPLRRRAVLERAAHLAGPGDAVHVICDGSLAVKLTGMFALSGLVVEADRLEPAEFSAAAATLAPFACGWTWTYIIAGARGEAVELAVRFGLPLVAPERSAARPWATDVVVTQPSVVNRRPWYAVGPLAGRGAAKS